MAVGAGVVHHHQIAHVDLGQRPLDRELVVVLAQRADHIVDAVLWRGFLSND